MPLPHSIELHDSKLAEVHQEGATLVLRLSPAYIHRDGRGWSQEAEVAVAGGASVSIPGDLPVGISDGVLITAQGRYDNLLLLPLNDSGPSLFELVLVSGEVFRVEGGAVTVRLLGEPRFLEDVA